MSAVLSERSRRRGATTRRGDARGEGIDRDASAPLMPTFTMTDARVRGLRRGERAVARRIRRSRPDQTLLERNIRREYYLNTVCRHPLHVANDGDARAQTARRARTSMAKPAAAASDGGDGAAAAAVETTTAATTTRGGGGDGDMHGAPQPLSALWPFIIISITYLLFTVTDGAVRMLVLLHAYTKGFSAMEVAIMFSLYELMGAGTNLAAGVCGARWGIRATLLSGLTLQARSFAFTLVPVRPRWRGGRRSLRTLPGASLRPSLAVNPRPRCLSTPLLTPLNSTPTSSLRTMDPRPSSDRRPRDALRMDGRLQQAPRDHLRHGRAGAVRRREGPHEARGEDGHEARHPERAPGDALQVRRLRVIVLSVHTGSHTTASALCSPFLKDFRSAFLSAQGPSVSIQKKHPPRRLPFDSTPDAFRLRPDIIIRRLAYSPAPRSTLSHQTRCRAHGV